MRSSRLHSLRPRNGKKLGLSQEEMAKQLDWSRTERKSSVRYSWRIGNPEPQLSSEQCCSATDILRFVLLKVYSGSCVEMLSLGQGSANCFCEDPDSKYVRFCEPSGLSQLLTCVCSVTVALDICK